MASDQTSNPSSGPSSLVIPTIHLNPNNTGKSNHGDHEQQSTLCSNEWEEKLVLELQNACFNVGFFVLDGHGIDPAFLDKVFDQSRQLFDLPLDVKNGLSDKVMSRGYTAFEEETLDPEVQSKGDTKEGFYIRHEIGREDPRYNPSEFQGPNQWPDPAVLPHFRTTMEKYFETLSQLSMTVVRLIARALGLPANYFDKFFVPDDPPNLSTLRLIHYSSEPSDPDSGLFACGAHSDYGMLTLLLTDSHPGLQILYKGEWISVPPQPYAFVVNFGDMLERWTNGLCRSTLHRVVTPKRQSRDDYDNSEKSLERYSIPFFFDPPFNTNVSCLDICCDSNSNPPKYPPTTAGQHLLSKYLQTHADFTPDVSS